MELYKKEKINDIALAQAVLASPVTVFSYRALSQFMPDNKRAAIFNIVRKLIKAGVLERLDRGIYVRKENRPDSYVIANSLYSPSYISLEFALSYHGVIPETVYEITSVTTKATRRFETLGKIFSFRKIKKGVYTGYGIERQGGLSFYIADAEKAFVDTNYLRLVGNQKPISRFNKEKINPAKALRYAELFGNNNLTGIIKTTLI